MPRLTVNNQPIEYRMDAQTPLLWALRDASNLTGTKYGCGTGDCGACTVEVDGAAVLSCRMTLAAAEGTFVTTIEGLSRDRTHPLQQALVASNVVQCGFCIPGVVMAGAILLERNRDPSAEDIAGAIPNLCRCGIYPRLVEAVRQAARIARGDETVPAPPVPDVSPEDAAREVPAIGPATSERAPVAPQS